MPTLRIGDLIAKLPVIQGGMGVGVSGVSLVAAVAGEGGIGVLSAACPGIGTVGYRDNPVARSIETLKHEIESVRAKTNGILGVNIMVATSDFSEMVKAAIESKVDIIFSGAGLPVDLPGYLTKGAKTKLVPIISSAKAASVLLRRWISKYQYPPDAFVVEGPMAGGHLGFRKDQLDDPEYALQKLIPEVIEAVKPYEESTGKHIPVIAAGGIYTGNDIREFLGLGAEGVQMGTRFVTTAECDVSDAFKDSYIQCNVDDIAIIDSPVGMPGRAIRNEFLESVENGTMHPVNCPYHCIRTCDVAGSPYCIAMALLNAKNGNMKRGFAFAGQNAYRATEITSVHELIESLKSEYAKGNE